MHRLAIAMMAMAMAIAVAVACGGASDAPVAEPPACGPALTAAQQRIGAAIGDRAWQTMIAACEAEHWSGEALACIASARLPAELTACTEKLTFEQHERLERKLAWLRGSPYAPHADAGGVAPAPVLDGAAE